MLLGILLAVLIVVCLSLIGVILLQRSEGGALGMSGSGPGAFMTARGTGDLLTRATQILAGLFFSLCLAMTLISGHERNANELIEKVKGLPPPSSAPSAAPATTPGLPTGTLPTGSLPAAPFGALPGAPVQPPLAAPPANNSLNLLGSPQAPVAVPTRRPAPPAAKATPAAKTPPRATPAPKAAPVAAKTAKTPPNSAAAPLVTPAPVALPTPAPSAATPAAPSNGQ